MADNYHDLALSLYGDKCEWEGCGWNDGPCDVHHIDYQEQQAMERKIRQFYDENEYNGYQTSRRLAKESGWGKYDPKTRQLEKNSNGENLAVLCPNHHRSLHHHDLGKKALAHIPTRKSE